ncbi:MAG: DNA-deoxyinosine glycosylase, partial [Tepidisphaeraceae bacterium]
ASLRQRQYYAHPQNAFWKIIGEILGCDPAGTYETRTAALSAGGIALWDVLKSCAREGSLDSDIDSGTIVPNDFPAFFATHPHIRKILFNGARAQALYLRHVRPLLAARPEIPHIRLPSTSPANASIPLAEKVRAWSAVLSSSVPFPGPPNRPLSRTRQTGMSVLPAMP